MVLTVAFFADQYQKQQLLRQASAADSTLHIEPGAQGVYTLLLIVQQEEPAFVLARADGPQQTVTLCALPVRCASAHLRTTTLAECAVCRGRAGRTAARRHSAGGRPLPRRCTISRPRPPPGRLRGPHSLGASTRHRCWMPPHARAWATVRTPSPCTAAQASELIAQLQAALPRAGSMARAAVWAAFLRQDPALLAGR